VKNVLVLNDTVFILQGLRFMVFNATFNNISVIWRSVLLVEEPGVPGETHPPVAGHNNHLVVFVIPATKHAVRIVEYKSFLYFQGSIYKCSVVKSFCIFRGPYTNVVW
jgi:hypothetical protein